MNFQAVREANGNNVVINAIATLIDGTTYTQAGKPKQYCKFTDANGEQQGVSIYQGTGQPIPPEKQGITLSINISAKTSPQGNKLYYGGFWNSNAQVKPISVQTPQQPRQAPQQAAQQPNAPQNDRNISIEREVAFKAACEYCGRMAIPKEQLIKVAKAGHYFIATGNDINDIPNPDPSITNPNYVGDNPPPPTGDGIPF